MAPKKTAGATVMPVAKGAAQAQAQAQAAPSALLPQHFANVRKMPTSGVPDARLTFDIVDVDLCIVNAIRRAMMAEVPTAAFRYEPPSAAAAAAGGAPASGGGGGGVGGITIKTNSSVLHNEFIAHRVSMVPICFNENQLRVFEPWQWRFKLHVKNTSAETRPVTTADFEVFDNMGARMSGAVRDALFPPNPLTQDHVLITLLRPSTVGDTNGEELHLECSATLGTGRQHARWSPVSCCHFNFKVDEAEAQAALKVKLAEEEATHKPAPFGERERRQVEAQHACLGAPRCFVRNQYGEPSAFQFFVETEGRLRPAYVVFKSLQVLQERVAALRTALLANNDNDVEGELEQEQELEELGGSGSGSQARVEVIPSPNMDDFYQVLVRGEDHTIGNLVQGMLYKLWVREGGANTVSYVGYHQPHPLEDYIILRIKCAVPGDDIRARLADGLQRVRDELRALSLEWVHAAGMDGEGIAEVNDFLYSSKNKTAAARVAAVA